MITQEISQQKVQNDYLAELLVKRTQKKKLAEEFINDRTNNLENDIISGKYQIKSQQFKVEDIMDKEFDRKKNIQLLHTKKQLEDRLHFIENGIEEISKQSQKKTMTEEERAQFFKKMEKQRKDLLKKKEEHAKFEEQKRTAEQKKIKQQKQKQEQQKKDKKMKELEERMKLKSDTKSQKEIQFKNQNKILMEKIKEKILSDKIQQNYHRMQNINLEQRKKRLAQIRTLHKPIQKKQLDQHAQKIQQMKQQKSRLMEELKNQETQESKKINYYKSIFYQRIKKQQKNYLDKSHEEQLSKMKEARHKLKRYSEQVRTQFKPNVSKDLEDQLKFKNIRNKSLNILKPQDRNKMGLRYLEYSKLHNDPNKKDSEEESLIALTEKNKKINYLEEFKQKTVKVTASAHDFVEKLQKTKMSFEQKSKKIFQFTNKLEQKAKRKEEIDKAKNNGVDEELDGLYLQAIEAKLSLLDAF